MFKGKFVLSLVLCSVIMLHAETVSITGTVKKTGSATGLAGVKINLAKIPSVFATSEASGAFTLTGTTSIAVQAARASQLQFAIKGNSITFTAAANDIAGRIEIFAGNGKRIAATEIKSQSGAASAITLPELSSGLSIMQLTINGERFTRTLMSVDNNIFLYNGKNDLRSSGEFTLAKRTTAAAVDTLVVSKTGFTTKKVPVESYSKQGVAIELDSGSGTGGKCTRESLKAIVAKYIEAQTAGDPTKMPLAENVKIKMNSKDTSLEKSILKQALKIDFNLSIYDVDSCRTFTEVIVANSTPQYVIGTRLRVKDEKITGIDMIVTKKGDWLFNAADYLKYAKQQDWYILPEKERSTREKLVDAGDQYLDMFNGDFEGLPWGAPCYRIEGGAITLKGDTTGDYCKVKDGELAGGKFVIGGRDFVVDVELGAMDVFCAFCVLDSHLCRLVNGHYRYVHTLTVGCK